MENNHLSYVTDCFFHSGTIVGESKGGTGRNVAIFIASGTFIRFDDYSIVKNRFLVVHFG